MVSKPTGSRPPMQSRANKRRDQQAPDVLERPAEPQAGTSRVGGERTPAGGNHSHTLPLGTSVPTGGQQMASRAARAATGGRSGGSRHPQTLPGRGARVVVQGGGGEGQTHRGGSNTSGGPPAAAASSRNPLRAEVRPHEQLACTSHQRPQARGGDPKERYARQGASPSHTLPATHHQAAPRDPPPPPPPSSKHGRDARERYVSRHQGQHRQQATTLPLGGASGSGGGGRHHHQGGTTVRLAPARPTASASAATASTTPSSGSSAQAQRTVSSRDNHVTERRQSPPGAGQGGGGRERDIARITIDARTIVTRPAPGGGATSGANHLPPAVSSGSVPAQQAAGPPPPPPQYPAPRRNPAPAPPTGGGGNASQLPVVDAHLTVDPSSLRLDIVDRSDQQIVTNYLSAGIISYGRPERPETTEALPDLLNSHVLPPYTVRQNQHRAPSARAVPHPVGGGRSRRRSRSRSGTTRLDDDGKACCSHEGCLRCVTVLTTFRWVLVSLALLGVVCVVTGIVLGALHMTVGSSFLTLSLMFIGLGVMLVVVVGVGWKCTPQGHEPCHLLFNLGDHCTRDVRSSSSHRRHRDRNHWYGGVTYPEFRYRRPPPSYSASMQEFQQQLMLAQIQLNQDPALPPGENDDNYSLPSSPPPSYKSRASTIRPGLHITFPPQGASYPNSQPPTYRSRGVLERPALNLEQGGVDNLACSDADAPWSTSSAASSSVTSPMSSSRTSPARSLPDSASSTLHRAADRVVDYLDDVLQHHDRTEHRFGERPARPVTGGAGGAVERPARPVTGGGVGVSERPARPVTGGAGLDAGVKTPIDALECAGGAVVIPGGHTVTSGAGGMTPGASLSSVRTTVSLDETDRIQDTQL